MCIRDSSNQSFYSDSSFLNTLTSPQNCETPSNIQRPHKTKLYRFIKKFQLIKINKTDKIIFLKKFIIKIKCMVNKNRVISYLYKSFQRSNYGFTDFWNDTWDRLFRNSKCIHQAGKRFKLPLARNRRVTGWNGFPKYSAIFRNLFSNHCLLYTSRCV